MLKQVWTTMYIDLIKYRCILFSLNMNINIFFIGMYTVVQISFYWSFYSVLECFLGIKVIEYISFLGI